MDKLSWIAVSPEAVLLLTLCVIALLDLGVKSVQRTSTYVLSLISLGFLTLSLVHAATFSSNSADVSATIYGFGRMVVSDPLGNWLKCFATVAVMFTFVYARPYIAARGMTGGPDVKGVGGEFFTLSLFALLGIYVLIDSNHLLITYLGLELLTLPSYALVALRRDHALSTEAAMKYFVLGALASGFLLYGLSMLYGATGTLELSAMHTAIATGTIRHTALVFGVVFVVAAIAFKLGVVPFHMWVADVYHGAPTAVTLLIGSAPKFAAFALLMRLLVEGLLPLSIDWQPMLMVLSVCSLVIGNLAAIAQTNIKRMLAFSAIGQMGFMLLGLTGSALASSYASAMFYVTVYVLTTLAAFGVLLTLTRAGFESEDIADLAGLNQRSPVYAGLLAIAVFSLAGIPPLAGFYAKFAILQSLVGTGTAANIALAVFAVMMSLIAAFYYLRIIKVMYFDAPTQTTDISPPKDVRVALSLNALLLIALGILPGGLMVLCENAMQQMLLY